MIKLLAVVLSLSLSGMCQLAFPAFGSVSGGSGSVPSSGLQVWYRGDSLTCTGGCSGTNPVTVLLDKSGNGNNCTASGTAPTFVASAVNSQPGVSFNNTPCALTTGVPWNNAITEFAVISVATTSHMHTLLSGVTQAVAMNPCYRFSGGFMDGAIYDNWQVIGHGGLTPCDTSWHQLGFTYCTAVVTNCTGGGSASNNLQFYIASTTDGSPTTDTTTGLSQNTATFGRAAVSATEYFEGTVTEVIMYNRVLSSSEISTIQAYLHTRYGT
jgi:hypothetical protein